MDQIKSFSEYSDMDLEVFKHSGITYYLRVCLENSVYKKTITIMNGVRIVEDILFDELYETSD